MRAWGPARGSAGWDVAWEEAVCYVYLGDLSGIWVITRDQHHNRLGSNDRGLRLDQEDINNDVNNYDINN